MENLAGRAWAEKEMFDGYLDGFDLVAPEPSANRSNSYRHGFANGRADRTGVPREGMSFDDLKAAAESSILADCAL